MTTSGVTLANWQGNRGYGLRNFERIVPDLLAVNAEQIRPLAVEREYAIDGLPAVRALCEHDACDGLLVLRGQRIAFEHYGAGMTPRTPHSCQSISKTVLNLLAGRAIADGQLDPAASVETYVPGVGGGYRGRSVEDVMAMNVRTEYDEAASAEGDRLLFDREESTMGFTSSSVTEMNQRDFVVSLGPGNEDGSNENRTGSAFYTTSNTALAGWIVERATGVSLQQGVRAAMHAIGAENTVWMALDRAGTPVVGGGFVMTLRDLGRYGMLFSSGGRAVDGSLIGGGEEFVRHTLEDATVPLTFDDAGDMGGHKYFNCAFTGPLGLGHAGWAGQWLWVDPGTETVIAALGGLMGENPVEAPYTQLLLAMTRAVVEHARG